MSKKGKTKNILDIDVKKKKIGRKNSLDFEETLHKSMDMVNESSNKNKKIRESRIGKTSLELMKEMEEYEAEEEENEFHFRKVISFFIIVILIIFAYLFFKYAAIFGISLNPNSKHEVAIDLVTAEDDIYDMYKNELLVYSNQKLCTYDKNGNKTWEYTLSQSFIPNIYVKDDYMVVSNNVNGYVYLFYNKREILDKKIEGTIKNVYLDSIGNIAIEYTTNGYKKIIGVYNKRGDVIAEIYLNSDSIIGIEILDNASRLLVTKVNSSSYSIGTNILVYDLKNDNVVDEIAKLDGIYAFKAILKKSNLYLLTESKIINVNINNKSQNVVKEFNDSQIIYSDISKDYYINIEMLFDSQKSAYQYSTYTYIGENICKTELENTPLMLANGEYLNYLVYQNELKVFNKWGVNIRDFSTGMYPKDIITFNEGKSVALIYTNKIDIFSI